MPETVNHTVRTAKRQYIDLTMPSPPPEDQEMFVVRINARDEIKMSRGTYYQTLNSLLAAWEQITGFEAVRPGKGKVTGRPVVDAPQA